MDAKNQTEPTNYQPQVASPEQAPRPRHGRLWKLVAVILLVLLVALVAFCYRQYQSLVSANNSINSLKGSNQKLTSDLSTAESKFAALKTEYDKSQSVVSAPPAAAAQSDIGLTINAAQYVNPSGTVTAGGTWFGVRLTLTNNTTSSIDVSAKKFTLKDGQGNVYQEMGFSGATTLPGGWGANTLQDQTIAAKGLVTSDLIFQVSDKSISNYTLVNDTKTYPVVITQ